MRGKRSAGCALASGLILAAAAADAADEDDLQARWSLSPTLRFDFVESPEDDNDVTGFFDQYEYVPNKSSLAPIQIGISDAALDLLTENETPVLRLRLASPTANLGVSGGDVDKPFFNQRGLLLGRLRPVEMDLRYWRIRTEELRLFPNTGSGALVLEDLTDPNDRFARERTGFRGEIRADVSELPDRDAKEGHRGPTVRSTLRGGYEKRSGTRQQRFLLEPSNRWLSRSQDRSQEVGRVGGGLVLGTGRLFTLNVEFDHERFREEERALFRSDVEGGAPALGTIGFVPDTDRYTGSLNLHGRVGRRAVLEGGFQASYLEQVGNRVPLQRSAGLRDNTILQTSARLAADVLLVGPFSANAAIHFEQRDNDVERGTLLFNPGNGTQPSPFVDRWTSLRAEIEGVYRVGGGNRLSVGFRSASVDRDLDYSGPGVARVLPVNSLVSDDSESYTFYGRMRLRLLRRVKLSGEVGYQIAPETGYLTDLDDRVYGKLRASYTLPVQRAVVLSLFARGSAGESNEQVLVSGVGEDPDGGSATRRFERTRWLWGLTVSGSPIDSVGIFASFFMSRDSQDYDLALSSLQRYLQPIVPVSFRIDRRSDYQDDQLSLVIGMQVQLTDETDAALSYSFTRAETEYDDAGFQTSLIASEREIDADIHGLDLELRHWLRAGLRVQAGYRIQHYDDRSRLPASSGSLVQPFDLTTTRHMVTVGATLTSALLED